jgi:hypothetical protein
MGQQHPTNTALEFRSPKKRLGSLLALFALTGCSLFHGETNAPEQETARAAPPTNSGPGKFHLRESQYVFYSDFPLKPNLPLFKELGELRDQVYKDLQLPASNTVIQVYLFEDQERYEKFMRTRYPDLPVRRAFFIKQPRNSGGSDDLLVFTYWHDYIRKDLRHELTHGLLHSVLRDVPLWLDEGLAEVYELPPENNGVNREHLEQIRKDEFHPDLAKLEQLSEVKQMQRPEYREAWAWTHFMLHSTPEAKAVLLAYLQNLRGPNSAGLLLPKLREAHVSDEQLANHIANLELPRVAKTAEQR